MAKDKITEYDSVADNNTTVGGVNLAENSALPSDMNNAVREVMSHLKEFSAGTSGLDVLSFQDDDNSHQLKFQAPSSVTTTTTFTLPDGDGSSGQAIVTNGSGTLSFSNAGGGSFVGESGGGLGDIIRVHENELNTSVEVASNTNGLCAGNLSIASGVTLTVSGTLVIV